MKPNLLPFLLLATSLAATAQTSPAAAPAFAPQPRTAADTVAAVHRLFAAKRKRCGYVVGGTAVAAGLGALNVLSKPAPRNSGGGFSLAVDLRSALATVYMLSGAAVVGIELLTFGGWGRRAEQQAVAGVKAHQLPRYLKRTLKARYFQPRPGL